MDAFNFGPLTFQHASLNQAFSKVCLCRFNFARIQKRENYRKESLKAKTNAGNYSKQIQ